MANIDFDFLLYYAVPHRPLRSMQGLPAYDTEHSQRVTPNTPALGDSSCDHFLLSLSPFSLPKQTIWSASAVKYNEANLGSLLLQPAVLHLSFKVT